MEVWRPRGEVYAALIWIGLRRFFSGEKVRS